MEVFVGRQPILDRRCRTVAFELLFRSSRVNACDESDALEATSQVIVNAALGVGLDRLLGGKPAFINFDRTLLLGDWSSLLSPENAIIELLENVPPDPEVLRACERLSEEGYVSALDDCVDDDRTEAFAPFVDVLKVDFRKTTPAEQERIIRRYGKGKLKLLAEKVETEEEFQLALKLGYDYFQGYFFAHPSVIQGARIPAGEISSFRLIKQLQREEPDFKIVEELIRHDVSFAHSLLTYLNSAVFHFAGPIESVRHALLLLGTEELRKWGWMVSLSRMGRGRPAELTARVLMRGRFSETIAGAAGLPASDADPFLIGMFSLMDSILRRPLDGILSDLNIARNLRAPLLDPPSKSNPMGFVMRIVRAYETADWESAAASVHALGVTVNKINSCYLEALAWTDMMMAQNREFCESGAANQGARNPLLMRKTSAVRIAPAAA